VAGGESHLNSHSGEPRFIPWFDEIGIIEFVPLVGSISLNSDAVLKMTVGILQMEGRAAQPRAAARAA
jgi:hypothetical protein